MVMASGSGRRDSGSEGQRRSSGESEQSSMRPSGPKKQLPLVPKVTPSLQCRAPPAPAISHNGTHATYGPYFLEYSLLAEYTLLSRQHLPGVYVQPSAKSCLTWFGVLFIRQGIYQDGVFKFTIYIPDNYPDGECPRVLFDFPIFHPLVDPTTAELDVKRTFSKWRRNQNHIWHLVAYIRRVFYKIETASPWNPEAAVLYTNDIELFKHKVVDCVKMCNSHLFDPPKIDDAHAIRFSPWMPNMHEEVRERMLNRWKPTEEQQSQRPGLSWVKPGSPWPFSKDGSPF
uniref:AKT-interacting protein isoform X1 n=1 Tax=Myxine glutinosa TaxID=7769 RepID=UPI00358DF7FF